MESTDKTTVAATKEATAKVLPSDGLRASAAKILQSDELRTIAATLSLSELQARIDYLAAFVLPERFGSLARRLEDRTRYMALCLEEIFYPHNASAAIRSAEAFGIQELHAVESYTRFRPSVHVVRGSDQWIDLTRWNSTPELVGHLRGKGYRIVVASPHEGGTTPSAFPVAEGPFALFLGTEKTGASEELMATADGFIHIPMVGFVESLNISVSAAILAQRLTERIREELPAAAWQLDGHDKAGLLFCWLMKSIRDSQRILHKQFPPERTGQTERPSRSPK